MQVAAPAALHLYSGGIGYEFRWSYWLISLRFTAILLSLSLPTQCSWSSSHFIQR